MVEDVEDDAIALRPGGGGGVWLNTSSIGTQRFSELDTTGLVHDGIRFTGLLIARPGDQWESATLVVTDGNLKGVVGATVYSGADLLGARLQFNIVDGEDETPVEIWVDSITPITSEESRYVFKTLDDEDQAVPVCDADPYGNHTAVPIADVTINATTGAMQTRANTVYLACTSGAVGKAAVWGYTPWDLALSEFELATRVVRADYCYDGASWTTNGTALQVHDLFGVNTFLDAGTANEVVWTADGAACIATPRNSLYGASAITCGGQPLPTCPVGVDMATYPGALFWTKLAT